MTHSVSRFFLITTLMTLVSACSVAPKYEPSQPPVDDRTSQSESSTPSDDRYDPYNEPAQTSPMPSTGSQTQPQQAPAQPQIQQNSAVIALLDNAAQSRATGDYRSAQGSLQRAQRIAPRDPEVYFSLSQTHLELEDYDLAEQVALKGVSLVQGNNNQRRKFWNLIAKIRLRAGDANGARQAEAKANSY
jgi:tetratricopeptide (TPR) repeat protein